MHICLCLIYDFRGLCPSINFIFPFRILLFSFGFVLLRTLILWTPAIHYAWPVVQGLMYVDF
jgi:hypothetical protein